MRWIAEKMSIPASTAHDWIKQGRAAEVYIDLLDRAEERVRMATRLDFYTSMLMDQWRTQMTKEPTQASDIVPILLRIEERRAKLGGLDAPTRVAVEDGRTPEPDPRTVAAVRAAQQRAAAETRELLEGDPS